MLSGLHHSTGSPFCILIFVLLVIPLFLLILLRLLPGVQEVPQPAAPCELRLDDQVRGGDVPEGGAAGREQV